MTKTFKIKGTIEVRGEHPFTLKFESKVDGCNTLAEAALWAAKAHTVLDGPFSYVTLESIEVVQGEV